MEGIGESGFGNGYGAECGTEVLFVEIVLENVCLDARVCHFEGIEACFVEYGGEDVTGRFGVGGGNDVSVEVAHGESLGVSLFP